MFLPKMYWRCDCSAPPCWLWSDKSSIEVEQMGTYRVSPWEPTGVIQTTVSHQRTADAKVKSVLTCSAFFWGGEKSITFAAGTIDLGCGCVYIVICLPPRAWLEPHGELNAQRSGGAVFTFALEIHHRPLCDLGSKRCWDNSVSVVVQN